MKIMNEERKEMTVEEAEERVKAEEAVAEEKPAKKCKGGKKEEMERLIAEASQLTEIQRELGVTVDESSLSFANIVNAISVVQKNMGIMGTTAIEADGTISGSVASMKAAC